MPTLNHRLMAPLLALTTAACGLALSACQDVADPDDDASCEEGACSEAQLADPGPGEHADLAAPEERYRRDLSLDDASVSHPPQEDLEVEAEPTATLAELCTISGFPKPWGGANWGSARVELWSDQDDTCFYSRVTSSVSTSLCAWVDHPVFGTTGTRCATGTSVNSANIPAWGSPGGAFEAWGTFNSIPIWYDP